MNILRYLVALCVVAALLGGCSALQAPEFSTAIGATRQGVNTSGTVQLYNGGDVRLYSDDHSTNVLTLDGATGYVDSASYGAFDSYIDVGTYLNVGTWQKLTAQTAITVTAGGALAPTGTYQPIQAAGNVGLSDITVPAAGRLLILTNVSNTTITITDTGVIMLGGNAALAQYDTLVLLSDGTNLLQLSKTDN